MDAPARFDEPALDMILATLLRERPDSFVAAIDPGPNGVFVTMPPTIELNGQIALEAHTFLDVVVPSDRVVVIEAWEQARAEGAARTEVHLSVAPETASTLHFVDARARHGVYVGVLECDPSGSRRLAGGEAVSPLPPRIGRVAKSELAVIVAVDDAILRILGWSAEEMVGRRSLEFIHPDEHEVAIRDWMQLLSTTGPMPSVRQRLLRSDGGWTWFEVMNTNLLADPAHGVVVTEMIDISNEMAAGEAVRAREQLLRRLAEALPIGVLQATADARVVYTNERLHRILGAGIVVDVNEQLRTVSREDWPTLATAIESALTAGTDADLEVQVRPADEERLRRCLVRIRPLADEAGRPTGVILTLEDITESARLRAELERRATHDMLTRVMNRASVLAALESAIAGPDPDDTAVIFVDLDRFKAVNDQLGHAAGDELLRIVADRLAISIRAEDALGRIGGDEFLIVCSHVHSVGQARRVAERIGRALRRPVRLAATTVDLRASLGVTLTRRRAISADALVAEADAAMYESKRVGLGLPIVHGRALKSKPAESDRTLKRRAVA